ncbi:MAG: SLBB domain-containing protein [Planctomycetes bacterium]|nr:SLBB domain-containing protein [Planctomycetota bacterium]
MADKHAQASVPDKLQQAGGLKPGAARAVHEASGIAEADVYGVGSFFHLLAEPGVKVRVCTGLSCLLKGSAELLKQAEAAGLPVRACSCLAACDRAPAVLRDRSVLPDVTTEDLARAKGDWTKLASAAGKGPDWRGAIGPAKDDPERLAMNLAGAPDFSCAAFAKAKNLGAEKVIAEIEASGLQGRGGAGFPAAFKWKSVRGQKEATRYVVLNADEGEPGTFKDREVLLRRPDKVVEGLAIAALTIGAHEVYCYLRGEFDGPWRALEGAVAEAGKKNLFPGISFHLHAGQGAYICGEETALLEALEGKRGMPRLRPPYPTEFGLWGKPTLIHNVETISCVPAIVAKGGGWFKALGKSEPGTKLYCVSGHVKQPGVYELPLGSTLDDLAAAAGGYAGTLKAFSPGGASSGFLPASERTRPLAYKALAEVGSMLGSAGVVVLNDTVNVAWAAREQLVFFENESCGQCAPCRIGTRFQRVSVDHHFDRAKAGASGDDLKLVAEVAWEMNEGSICGLGQAASLPLTSALKYFPKDFEAKGARP